MNKNSESIRVLVTLSMLVTMATVLHVFEGLLPALPVTGARLGLANIITLTAIAFFGGKKSFAVVIGRTVLGSLFGPGLVSIGAAMSLAGGLFSWALMTLSHKVARGKLSLIGISLIGAVAHNLAQLTVASLFLEDIAIVSMLPILMIFALPTGIIVGLVARSLVRAMANISFLQARRR